MNALHVGWRYRSSSSGNSGLSSASYFSPKAAVISFLVDLLIPCESMIGPVLPGCLLFSFLTCAKKLCFFLAEVSNRWISFWIRSLFAIHFTCLFKSFSFCLIDSSCSVFHCLFIRAYLTLLLCLIILMVSFLLYPFGEGPFVSTNGHSMSYA